MLNIYILEDNPAYLKTLTHELKNFIMIEELSATIKLATASPKTLLQTIKPAAEEDSLYLLDIEIDNSDLSGVDVATAIRNASLFTDIIFVTNHTEAALSILTHKIAPLDLIDKNAPIAETSNQLRRDIQQVLDRVEDRKIRSHNQFNYSVNGQMFAVPLDELIYIQTATGNPGNLEVHALNETATFHDNLNHIASLYPTLFRVHKSVLVNPDHIKQLDTNNHYLYMDNDAKLDVSFRKQKLLKKMLNHHHSK
ncbi:MULTISPECIES: LytR/AlgR family response regulator transcription factor [Lacticaseibacillus]|uniref:LytTR family DNA-binding domain-containing protein n=1 Tax=Lacticaseibacillus huelsenbergensis TaxID=3035291 RepID=A0ABY8DTP0_9LACO|nr:MULTISPECIES: LytTR family DNA-binding domain-containing protein [Lacticaseibacillus]MDG3062402.1 LytTR family DNA-binding domain-containing protein [Lacticaseibacillus sp. BCRC 81376]WFB40369.1 LytTR family DNA-binding domain-containing protein [Lacticaseibacillus huelsenbergensis]WFB42122.1 LytTR family DNA-binding domain-containing protein [Lacticaseibacillus huelsenbergensis]